MDIEGRLHCRDLLVCDVCDERFPGEDYASGEPCPECWSTQGGILVEFELPVS